MLNSLIIAATCAFALSVTMWLLPKVARVLLALVIACLPYGMVRSVQIAVNVKHAYRKELDRQAQREQEDLTEVRQYVTV